MAFSAHFMVPLQLSTEQKIIRHSNLGTTDICVLQ